MFKDVDSTSPGADFVRVIQRTIAMCDVLLVVIGPRWLQKHDGVSRLDDSRDWVRIEILSALERNILVIPVLVDGAAMPSESDLPVALHPLARRQAMTLTETAWKSELNQLVKKISAHQRALDRPGDGDRDVPAGSRSAYHPFVGRSAAPSGSSRSSGVEMGDQTGRGAKELGDASEMPGADGLAAQLGKAGRRPLRRSIVIRYEADDADVGWPDSPIGAGRRGLRATVGRARRARMWRSDGGYSKRVAASDSQWFAELIHAWRQMAECVVLRRIGRSDRAGSNARKAGSRVEICDLVDATAGLEGPAALVTNVAVPGVVAGDHALYFLPDRVLVREGPRFAELSYATLRADWKPMRFAEREAPRDSERVGTTWERVNRDGSKNRRVSSNPEWPEMRYGRIELASEAGLRWILLCSHARAAERVIETFGSRGKPGSIVSVRAAGEH